MVAMKLVSQQEATHFVQTMQVAELNDRQRIYQGLSNQLENNLELIGATALLDELQLGVP